MRVAGGELKGRRIPLGAPAKKGLLRPTSSKVRESVFNILAAKIKDSVFADLYAGTGAVGIEAMSRGAKAVYFVDASRKMTEAIEDTLAGCGCRPRAVVVTKKAGEFIKAASERFDIVFLDPPYYSGDMDAILPLIAEGGALSDGAVVIAEHPSKKALPDSIGRLRKKKEYKYGDTMLTSYEAA